MIKKIFIIFLFTLYINLSYAKENIMILKLKDGDVVIELFDDIAPNHVQRFKKLSESERRVLRAIERAGLFGMGNFVFDSMFHSYTGIVGIAMGPTVAKGEALFKAFFAEGLVKQKPKALARELVKLTPALNVNKEIRDEAIKTLENFLKENTFMDEGSKWRKAR